MVIHAVHMGLRFRLFQFGGWLSRRGGRYVRAFARDALGIPPLGANFDGLLLQFFHGGVYGGSKVHVGANTHQLVIMIIYRDFGLVQMPFQRQDHVRFTLFTSIQKFAHLGKPRFNFLELGWSQFHLSACICDLHGASVLFNIRPLPQGRGSVTQPGRRQGRTRLWCVDGIFISSRYLATVRRVTLMPSCCSAVVIWSSVSGCALSSS